MIQVAGMQDPTWLRVMHHVRAVLCVLRMDMMGETTAIVPGIIAAPCHLVDLDLDHLVF